VLSSLDLAFISHSIGRQNVVTPRAPLLFDPKRTLAPGSGSRVGVGSAPSRRVRGMREIYGFGTLGFANRLMQLAHR
jgi:hypothetical protein